MRGTSNKLQHAVCKGGIARLKVANCIDQRFAGLDKLFESLPVCKVLNYNGYNVIINR
jgi:hypothetical protein